MARTFLARLRPAFAAGAMWATGLAGATGLVAPAVLTGGAWPPLHAHCVAVTALSLSTALAEAQRTLDPAALRMPLLALACWLLSMAALGLLGGGVLPLWHGGLAALGALTLALVPTEGDASAPAQRANRVWAAFADLALLAALPLLIAPSSIAAHWPWRLNGPLVAQYACMFLAWGAAAWQVSRERRRYVRLPVAWGVLVWAVGILLASFWHLAAFRWQSLSAWLWFAAFATTAAVSAHHVWPTGGWGAGRRLGPWSHDTGTSPSRH